ncbi:MAG TPA: hypothetical protein VHG08_17525 [Longimicrobium sp.]|nr:hypothetical protein [Longimicrobium sp.]
MSEDQKDSAQLDRLTAAAFALPEDERKRLILRLGESLVNDPKVDPARRARIQRRMELIHLETNREDGSVYSGG